MVHDLPLDDHFTQHYGKIFIAILLFQSELELPLRLPPLTKSLEHAIRARPSRAAGYTVQDWHKRDVEGHAPTQPRPRESQCGQALVEFALFFSVIMFVLAAVPDITSLLDAHVNLVYVARQRVCTGVVLGNRAITDCTIAGTIHVTLHNEPNVNLATITIFQIQHEGTVTGNKEVYGGQHIFDSSGNVSPAPTTNAWPASQHSNANHAIQILNVGLPASFAGRIITVSVFNPGKHGVQGNTYVLLVPPASSDTGQGNPSITVMYDSWLRTVPFPSIPGTGVNSTFASVRSTRTQPNDDSNNGLWGHHDGQAAVGLSRRAVVAQRHP